MGRIAAVECKVHNLLGMCLASGTASVIDELFLLNKSEIGTKTYADGYIFYGIIDKPTKNYIFLKIKY